MKEIELQQYLKTNYPKENEANEWKDYSSLKHTIKGHPGDDLVSYVSAISNMDGGHLVLGVEDKTLQVIGIRDFSGYNTDSIKLRILRECTNLSSEGLEVTDFITEDTNKTIWIISIPKHSVRLPVYVHGVAWQRVGDSLVEMRPERFERILNEVATIEDWSAGLVSDASVDDLDELALAKARIMFKKVHERIPTSEVDGWTNEEFLSHSGVMRDGKLTRAAILLLGRNETLTKIHPAVAQITWSLVDGEDVVQDYEHFTIPFILTVDDVLAKIRNHTMRELPGGTLFPDTMKQYDDYTIREALHNCIAHQDYTMRQRINFVEGPSTLYYSNGGTFIPGTLQEALEHKGPQRFYRNTCLCTGMVNFNMIDTVGRGIKKMFSEQKRRFFPMPDYEIDNLKHEVGVTIYGKMLNERYTKALKERTDLSMRDCILLDAVQKGRQLPNEARRYLRGRKLIEGKAPNISISLSVAKMTHQLVEYTKTTGLDRSKIRQMVLQFVQNAGDEGAKRDAIYNYIKDTLPSMRSDSQKERLLSNILSEMKQNGIIETKGRRWYAE